MSHLDALNEPQRQAVLCTEGPVMIVAGAGSGKTRVLTYRIAQILHQGTDPFQILALTFTNKAAREMRNRIEGIAGQQARHLWMGTFHSIFARLLRGQAEKIGYPSHFSIYDTDDSKSLIKTLVAEMQLEADLYKAGYVYNRISSAKNSLIGPEQYANSAELLAQDASAGRPHIHQIYSAYAQRCFRAGAMDFDDLLLKTFALLTQHTDVLNRFQHQFQYILVDEYQDTNLAQYRIIKMLAAAHRNLCVVGDDAQSIYGFRGANIQNILKFKDDYPELKTFHLEQNYRSTGHIVQAAGSLIARNIHQFEKKLWTGNEQGAKIRVSSAASDGEEGRYIASDLLEARLRNQLKYSEFAILYRTNAQSRPLEEALRRQNIPYRIYGGLSFYQRKEIKDMLAYLRLIVNPTDEEALRRIINYPTRGIGKTTLDRLYAWAGERNEPIWSLLTAMADQPAAPQGMNKVVDFVFMIRGFQTLSTREDAYQVAQHVSKHTGLHRLLVEDKSVEGISRMQNIEELLNAIREYTEEDEVDPTTGDVESRDRSLAGFLQHVALLTDADLESDDDNDEKVSLMTIHQAKGLEFSHVYVAGMEETLFPSSMSLESRADLEEERRLFYVAITRAEKRLTLTYAQTRFRHGNFLWPEPSRFLSELDPSCLDMRKNSSSQAASNYGMGSSGMRSSSSQAASNYGMGSSGMRSNGASGYSSGNTRPSTYGSSNGKSASTYGKAVHKPMPSRTAPANQESTNLVHFEPDDTTNLKAGMKVLHQRFGKGEVLSVEGVAPDHKATIRFIQQGEKIILLKFARMKIIG